MTGNEEIDALRAEVAMLRQMVASMAESGQMIGETMQAVQLGGCGSSIPGCYDISNDKDTLGNFINRYVMIGGIIVDGPTGNAYNDTFGKIIAIKMQSVSNMSIETYNNISEIQTSAQSCGESILPLYKMTARKSQKEEHPSVEIDFRNISPIDAWSYYTG